MIKKSASFLLLLKSFLLLMRAKEAAKEDRSQKMLKKQVKEDFLWRAVTQKQVYGHNLHNGKRLTMDDVQKTYF